MKKGQYFSFDAITGLLIFVITIGIVVTYWYNIQQVMNNNDASGRGVALRISDMLFTEGDPPDWDIYPTPGHVNMFGLMTNGSIDAGKVNKLKDWMNDPGNRDVVLEKMKTGGFNFRVEFSGDVDLDPIGPEPTCNTTVFTFTRVAPVDIGSGLPGLEKVVVKVWVCPE